MAQRAELHEHDRDRVDRAGDDQEHQFEVAQLGGQAQAFDRRRWRAPGCVVAVALLFVDGIVQLVHDRVRGGEAAGVDGLLDELAVVAGERIHPQAVDSS